MSKAFFFAKIRLHEIKVLYSKSQGHQIQMFGTHGKSLILHPDIYQSVHLMVPREQKAT